MSAAKHTPGPWRLGAESGVTQLRPRISILRDVTYVEGASPTTYIIGEVGYPTTTGNTVGAAERLANARLIAASPRLLALAYEFEAFAEAAMNDAIEEGDAMTADTWRERVESARAAIAAATGREA